jgi:hypothetical protein
MSARSAAAGTRRGPRATCSARRSPLDSTRSRSALSRCGWLGAGRSVADLWLRDLVQDAVSVDKGPFYIPFVDFQPTLDPGTTSWSSLGNDTLRPYITVIVGFER